MTDIMVILKRNTAWKCGRVERLILNYLRKQLQIHGRRGVPLRDIMQHLRMSDRGKSRFLDAVRRLERRNIVDLEKI